MPAAAEMILERPRSHPPRLGPSAASRSSPSTEGQLSPGPPRRGATRPGDEQEKLGLNDPLAKPLPTWEHSSGRRGGVTWPSGSNSFGIAA
jgi:hypothetical protein